LEHEKPQDQSECHEHSYSNEMLHKHLPMHVKYLYIGLVRMSRSALPGQVGPGTSTHFAAKNR
jgi:hypothetical protein